MRRRIGRWAAVAGFGLFAGGAAPGQLPANPLERARVMQAVADQRAEATVREVIADADRVAAASPTVAVQRLKRALVSLDLTVEVSATKRQELATLIESRVAALTGRPAPVAVADPNTARVKEASRKVLEEYAKETKDVRDGIAVIEKAAAANDRGTVDRKTAELARTYPNNPAVIALATSGVFGDRAAEAKRLAREQDVRIVAAMNAVQEAALPPRGDIEFPADWKKRTGNRDTGVKLGPDEEAILRALETQVRQGVKDAPFLETVQSISNLIGKEIYLDKKSLEEAGLDLQRPVTMPGNVTARTALRAVLQAQGLTFVIKEKLIQVVTLEKAQTLQVTKAYYLGELVRGTGVLTPGAVPFPGADDSAQVMANGKLIVDSITQSIDPLIWRDRGGPATILFHYPSLSLIVRAPAEVHASFNGKLSGR